jgi:hypothetical protein
MKLLLEIKDEKAGFIMELLNSFKFVKTKTLTPAKAQFLQELKEAVDEMNEIKTGKKKARNEDEVLAEL